MVHECFTDRDENEIISESTRKSSLPNCHLVVVDRVYEVYLDADDGIIKPLYAYNGVVTRALSCVGIDYETGHNLPCLVIKLRGNDSYIWFQFDGYVVMRTIYTKSVNIARHDPSRVPIGEPINDTGIRDIELLLEEPTYANAELLHKRLCQFVAGYKARCDELINYWPTHTGKRSI